MSARWAAFVDEWRTIPWTPRARRIGAGLEQVGLLVAILFGPALVEGLVNWLVP